MHVFVQSALVVYMSSGNPPPLDVPCRKRTTSGGRQLPCFVRGQAPQSSSWLSTRSVEPCMSYNLPPRQHVTKVMAP